MNKSLLGTMRLGAEVLQLVELAYEDGSPAIEVRDGFGGPYAKLSVNTGRPLAPRHVAIKTWSENEELAEAALATGLFEATGLEIPTGFVSAPVWRIRDEKVGA